MSFPHSIQTDRGQPSKVRIGVIGADGTLTIQGVTFSADSIGFLGSYMPTQGDTVAALGQSAVGTSGSSWLILGAVGASSAPLSARVTVQSPVAEVTFTVPQTLSRLTVSWSARSGIAAVSTAIRARINGDSSANYHTEMIQATGAGAAVGSATASATSWMMGVLAGNTAPADFFSAGELFLPGWDAPHFTLSALWRNTSISSGGVTDSGGGIFNVAGPYTSVTFFPDGGANWVSGSDFQLQGWTS